MTSLQTITRGVLVVDIFEAEAVQRAEVEPDTFRSKRSREREGANRPEEM
jgi:hypothetical protein